MSYHANLAVKVLVQSIYLSAHTYMLYVVPLNPPLVRARLGGGCHRLCTVLGPDARTLRDRPDGWACAAQERERQGSARHGVEEPAWAAAAEAVCERNVRHALAPKQQPASLLLL